MSFPPAYDTIVFNRLFCSYFPLLFMTLGGGGLHCAPSPLMQSHNDFSLDSLTQHTRFPERRSISDRIHILPKIQNSLFEPKFHI